MPRRTLIDFFNDLEKTKGEFLTYDDGYRSWSYTYREVVAAARAVAARLRAADIGSGQHVALWSENRPEWVWTLWGCLLEGVVLVPIDYRTSADFLHHVAEIVSAKAIIVGDTVGALESEIPVWSVRDIGSGKSETPQILPRRHAGHGCGSHLHVRRDLRTEGCGAHPPQHPGEHHPHRT